MFYKTLRFTVGDIKRLDIYRTNNVSQIINFTDILTTFPKLGGLATSYYHSANWISEILQAKHYSLMRLRIRYDRLRYSDQFDIKDFLTFIKTRRIGFDLAIRVTFADNILYFSKLKNYLDQKLVVGYAAIKYTRTQVSINYGNMHGRWYVPLNGDILRIS
uniref:FBA_2 domain-containing protein n=1 Tax=Panagrellus redivivus TaxID=6233 RepID=A0A7E4W0H7_PANRE